MAGNDSNTKVLLHCDGTNGATSFPDVNAGGSAHTWTATGATVSTAQSEFGGASATFSGNGQFLSATSSADWNFSGDFTVDYWVRFTALGSNGNTMTSAHWTNNDGSGSLCANLHGNASPNFAWAVDFNTSFTSSIVAASAPVINTWYHVAIVRSGTTITLYINGTSVGSVTNSSTFANGAFSIGRATQYGTGSNRDLAGFIDEFRVSNTARWTSNFTPPASAYSAAYSLSTSAASYSLTGSAATLGKLYRMATTAASYAITGAGITIKKTLRLTASAGSFAYTGVAAVIGKQLRMAALAGSFALTGTAASLKRGYRMATSAGAFVLTGISLVQVLVMASPFIRKAKFVLQKLRSSSPVLNQ